MSEHLLPAEPVGPVDLTDTLIVVPTRQAGRCLRETLATVCAQRGSTLLSADTVTPSVLLRMEVDATHEASQTAVAAVWARVLMECPEEVLSTSFPPPSGGRREYHWALRTGEMLQQTRQTLGDGGYTISDVIDTLGENLPEPDRWKTMLRLETLYLDELSVLSLEDPCSLKIRSAQAPALSPEIKRIVVAAVPDPSLLALHALGELSKEREVEILVHAPVDDADSFDKWGRPIPEKWRNKPIGIPNPQQRILLCASPASQSRRVIAEIASIQGDIGPADVAIGAPDRSVIPYLEEGLSEAGVQVYDPSEQEMRKHRLYHLVERYTDLLLSRSYAALRDFVRHPDVLLWMENGVRLQQGGEKLDGKTLLEGLDKFQNDYLPQRLDDVISKAPEGCEWSDALISLDEYLRERSAQSLDEGLRVFLQDVYAEKRLKQGVRKDVEFQAVAEILDGVLRELRNDQLSGPYGSHALDPAQMTSLLMRRLRMESYHAERTDAVLDIEGWLELPWNDAQVLIVTGMNEGMVPDGRLSDAVLPDSLRNQLGLRDDESRLARDAFLMTTLVESRRCDGRTFFLLGKTSATGDPLKPSRLLFRCPDEELVERAELLFREAREVRPNVASSASFALDPSPMDERSRERLARRKLSVTAFRDYLVCPFRFYLKHVLEMSSLSDDKVGMDELDFGNMMHSVLEEMGRTGIWKCTDESRLRGFFNDELDKWMIARMGKVRPLPVEVALDAARQRLGAFAVEQVALVQEGWEIIHTEQKVEIELNGMVVGGKIDRVDRHAGSGAIRVLDYKTSDRAKTPFEAHITSPGREKREFALMEVQGRKKRWVDLQLPLYHHIVRVAGLVKGNVQVGYINLPKAVGDTAVDVWDGLSEDLLASALECSRGVIDGIRNGVFWPPAERVAWDDYEDVLLGDPLATVAPTGMVGMVGMVDG